LNELITVHRVSADARGAIYELGNHDVLHINLLTLRKGLARGGHSHSYPETFFILSGRVEYHTGSVESDAKTSHGEGSTITTTPGEPHYLLALDDSSFLEFRPAISSNYQASDYPPFRTIVLNLLQTHPTP
jgi:quercetin dioxygenase-like cupin family protein